MYGIYGDIIAAEKNIYAGGILGSAEVTLYGATAADKEEIQKSKTYQAILSAFEK